MTAQRKPHRVTRFQREAPKYSGDHLLIVCEGSKTEPGYFKGLKNHWRLHPAQIVIVGPEEGNAPISIVEYALARKKENLKDSKKQKDIRFDEIWCVFDHEGIHEHPSLVQAINKAQANHLKVALSIPSFEFWYLLHFEYTTHHFSCCDDLIDKLKIYLPNYEKCTTPSGCLIDRLKDAYKNAEIL
ncbi:MAG: RloB family protein, partial [bacterium]